MPATKQSRLYKAHGAAKVLWGDRRPEVILSGPAGTGKAQPLDSIVWTPDGPVTMGSLEVGDLVLTPDGGSAPIKAVFPQGEQDVYRITFTGGDSVECTSDHLWAVRYTGGGKRGENKVREMADVRRLEEIIPDYLTGNRKRPKYWIPQSAPVGFDAAPVSIDPYVLGVLIGDGYIRKGEASFTSADLEVGDHVSSGLGDQYRVVHDGGYHYRIVANGFRPSRGTVTAKRGYTSFHAASGKWMARARVPGGGAKYLGLYPDLEAAQSAVDTNTLETHHESETTGRGIWHELAQLGLEGSHAWDKFVPVAYKRNSLEVRRATLQGLMDTDGTVDVKTGTPSFTSVSLRLAQDVKEIVESLGGICRITSRIPKCGPKEGRRAYTCWIRLEDSRSIFRLERKRAKCQDRTKYPVKRMILEIAKVGRKPCQCIAIDSRDSLYLTDHFVVTHNSRACLEKVHACCLQWPGSRWLIVRKTRESLTESGLVTWEEKVLPEHSPIAEGPQRKMRQAYHYPNGSEVVVGGLDKPSKVMSTEYDGIYVQEAIELFENDFESLTTRLRNGVMPFQQIIGDTNPDSPMHWLKRRADAGKTVMLESRHEDNPTIFDPLTGKPTEFGRTYIARLDNLSGVRLHRLRYGRWVAAEGVVYEGWDRNVHLIDRFPIPASWRWIRSADFGFTNPFVFGWIAIDNDGRMYLTDEIYKTQRTVADHAKQIKEINGARRIEATPADHDAEDRATLAQNGIHTIPAFKAISPGIQAIQERLKVAGDGRPRLFVFRDALVERDELLAEAKKPTSTAEEFDGYMWPKGQDGKSIKEVPVDADNHGMDMLRYAVAYVDHLEKGAPAGQPSFGGQRAPVPNQLVRPPTSQGHPARPQPPGSRGPLPHSPARPSSGRLGR